MAAGTPNSDQDDAGGTPAAGAAAANPSPPVAAVIVLTSAGDASPAAANASIVSAAIGAQSKTRAPADLSRVAGQDVPTTNNTPAAKSDPSANNTTASPAGASDPSGSASPTPATPAQTATNSAAIVPPPPDPSAQIGAQTALPATPTLAASLTSAAATGDNADSSGSPSAAGAVKAAGSDLPSLGIAAPTTATNQAAPAISGTPLAAAVSVSGLPVTIAARAKAGSNQFDIRLDPPELGRIDVQLSVDSKGQVTSHVTVDRPETLTLLQSQQPQLEHALEQAGLKTADNGLQFSLRDQSFTGQNNNGGGAQPSTSQLVIPDPDLAPIETRQIYARASRGGGIDIRV